MMMMMMMMILCPQVEGYAAKTLASSDPAAPGNGKGASRISTATRQLYSTQMLGPKVQLLVLDYRRGYLGKEQVSWLADTLKNSTATWKLVLTGAPFGVAMALPSDAVDDNDVATAESKEVDHQSAATVVDVSTIQHQQQPAPSTTRTPRDEFTEAAATVKLTLPPPIEAAGCDEAGRYKLSLQGVIASIQKTTMADKEKSKQFQQQEGRDEAELAADEIVDATTSSSSSPHQPRNAEGQQQHNDAGLVLSIESGIVILSAGACVLEPAAAAAAAAAAASMPLSHDGDTGSAMVSPAFVAVYDPCGSGSPFCIEMCIGGGDCFDIADAPPPAATATMSSVGDAATTLPLSKAATAIGGQQLRPSLSSLPVSSLGPHVLFDHKAVAAVAALASFDDADSPALHLKLVAVATDGQLDGQPLFACTLVQPTANITSSSLGNDAMPNPY